MQNSVDIMWQRKIMLVFVFLFILPIISAIELNTSTWQFNAYFGGGSVDENTSNYNITAGIGQTYIKNVSYSNFWEQWGIYYFSQNLSYGDVVDPVVALVNPTTLSGNFSQTFIVVNVSASDSNLDTIITYLFNVSGQVYSNESISSPFLINYTSLAEGLYYINATANDTWANIGNTATHTIQLDTTNPVVNITSPNATTYSSSTILINFSATDNVGINIYWYSNGSVNTTYTTPINITLTNGNYNYIFYANDSAGNVNSTIVNFNVSVSGGVAGAAGIGGGEAESSVLGKEEKKGVIFKFIKTYSWFFLIIILLYSLYVRKAVEGEADKQKKKKRRISPSSYLFLFLLLILAILFPKYILWYLCFAILYILYMRHKVKQKKKSKPIKPILSLLLLLLFIPSVFADCNSDDIMDKITSDCKIDNGNCDDGENVFIDKDCELDKDFLKDTWVVRLLLILLLYLLITRNKYFLLVGFFIAILLVYNGSFGAIEVKDTPSESSVCSFGEFFKEPTRCIWPSEPMIGLLVLIVLAAIIWERFFQIK